jgi:hypothetical protein
MTDRDLLASLNLKSVSDPEALWTLQRDGFRVAFLPVGSKPINQASHHRFANMLGLNVHRGASPAQTVVDVPG